MSPREYAGSEEVRWDQLSDFFLQPIREALDLLTDDVCCQLDGSFFHVPFRLRHVFNFSNNLHFVIKV